MLFVFADTAANICDLKTSFFLVKKNVLKKPMGTFKMLTCCHTLLEVCSIIYTDRRQEMAAVIRYQLLVDEY